MPASASSTMGPVARNPTADHSRTVNGRPTAKRAPVPNAWPMSMRP